MVLGLIDFLLGGKKKTKVSRSGQVVNPAQTASVNANQPASVPNGADQPTQNATPVNDASAAPAKQADSTPKVEPQNSGSNNMNFSSGSGSPMSGKVSEILSKMHKELKSTNEKITELVTDVKNVENTVNSLGHRVDDLEEAKKTQDEKLSDISSNMNKFLSLYELINNQYNPFVDQETPMPQKQALVVNSEGSSQQQSPEVQATPSNPQELTAALDQAAKHVDIKKASSNDLDESLLELDTLNIEEAAGNAVPLTILKNNTNSLVIILSWLEYLIKKVGIEETRNSLRYYTEVLRWITPEVYFDLDKYLGGMKDKKEVSEGDQLTVRDHIVSLYFISKLNEKVLDEKLTRAVLQIIKQ